MALNCNEINLILSELKLEGYFIQDIIQPGFDTLALFTYGKEGAKTVLICTASNSCRINETNKKIVKNSKPLRFMEFLKSRIKGAKITGCIQIGLQRIIKIDISKQDKNFVLYVRLWSNASNVFLCTPENIILDSMYRRPSKNEITGEILVLPEADNNSKLKNQWQIRDFSEIRKKYSNLYQNKEISFNQAVDIWYSEYAGMLSIDNLIQKAEKQYQISKSKMETALEHLKKKQAGFKNAQKLKHQGDLILSFGHSIKKDSKFLECIDYETGKLTAILINPEKSTHENAQEYYSNYKKALSGLESISLDIEIAEKRIKKLDELYNQMLNEKNPIKLEQLLRKTTTPKQKIKKAHPGIVYIVNSWYIIAGRNANENDELLRRHVRGEDIWLHVRDFAGGYVFIKNKKDKTLPLDILLDAANLAVYYSKARNAGKTDLYYTKVKYLKRVKNAPKGLVLPSHEKNICIEPDKKRLARLDSIKEELN